MAGTQVTGADRSASTGLWRLETEGGGADSGAESSAYHGVILADPMTVAEGEEHLHSLKRLAIKVQC